MPDLFAPTVPEQIACLRREIEMRRRVYPRFVSEGRMTQGKADREIAMMEAAAETLAGGEIIMQGANACLLIVDHLCKDFQKDTAAMVEMLRGNGYTAIAQALARIAPKKGV